MFKIVALGAKSRWPFLWRKTPTATLLVLRDTELTAHRVGHDLFGAVEARSGTVVFREGERIVARLAPGERAAIGDVFAASDERVLAWLRPEIQNRLARTLNEEWAAAC